MNTHAPKLTSAQRSYLELMARENLAALDVASGGASQCIGRLRRMGFIEYVSMEDWRDSFYRITAAGRSAVSAGERRD